MAECAPHNDCDPDVCFAAKMKYMRRSGVGWLEPKMGHGHRFWDTTIAEVQRQCHAEAAANGNEFHVKHPIYDKPSP